MVAAFFKRNSSWWCDRCGDQVAEACDPVGGALLREHMTTCLGRRVSGPRSSGYWMGGPPRRWPR